MLFSCQFSINVSLFIFLLNDLFVLVVEVIGLVEVQLMYHTSTDSRIIINDAESCISKLLCLLAVLLYAAEEDSVMCHAVVNTAILYATSKWSE